MIVFLFSLSILGVALLANRIFNHRVGILAALLFAVSSWSKFLVSSGEAKFFLTTIFLTYGLWLIFRIRPRFGLCFLIFASLLTFLVLHPSPGFWLKHGFSSSPTFVPIIHEHINSCHQALPLLICRLVYNKPSFFSQQYLLNFLGHFSTDSLFITPKREGILFAPFFYLGLFSIFISWRKNLLLISWILLYPLVASFTIGFDYFHSIFGWALLPMISAFGIFQTISLVVRRQK